MFFYTSNSSWEIMLRTGFGLAKAKICTSGKNLMRPTPKMKGSTEVPLATVFQWFQQNNLEVQAPNTYFLMRGRRGQDTDLFFGVASDRIWMNDLKLRQREFSLCIRKRFLTQRALE